MELANQNMINDVAVIKFTFSEIGFEERDMLKESLNKFLQDDTAKYVFNLSKVGFLSSLVISVLIYFSKEIKKKEGQMKLCEFSPEGKEVMEITHLNTIFDIYETQAEAISSF